MKSMRASKGALLAAALGVALLALVSCTIGRTKWKGHSAVYDPTTDTWHEANRAVEHSDHGSALVEHMGTLYQFTGKYAYACDLATDTWTFRASPPREQNFGAAFVIHDRIYVFLSADGSPLPQGVGEYNPILDEWTQLANVPNPLYGSFAACVNDRIYLIGGEALGSPTTPSGDVWEYEPLSDSWTLHGSTYGRSYALCVALGSNIYIFGGNAADPLDLGDKVLCYTPSSNSNMFRNDIDVPGYTGLTMYSAYDYAVVVNDLVYVATEWGGLVVYDYMTDTWTDETGPGFDVRGMAATGDGRFYAFGGGWVVY